MKKTTLLWAVWILSAVCVWGDDPKGGQVLIESQSPKKEKEEKKAPVAAPKGTNTFLGQPVVYGGYFTDFARTEKKRALFDLKTPLDFRKDSENVSFYPNTEKVQGIILFSVKF